MPQMAPLNWLILFFMFIYTFMLFSSTNYFFKIYSIKKYSNKYKKMLKTWKW